MLQKHRQLTTISQEQRDAQVLATVHNPGDSTHDPPIDSPENQDPLLTDPLSHLYYHEEPEPHGEDDP
eukprot:4215314-Pyramimonas_sp.AAC.1